MVKIAVMGGSITRSPNLNSYYDQLKAWLPVYTGWACEWYKLAEDGTPSSVRLIDYDQHLLGVRPDYIFIDAVVNDGGSQDRTGQHADGWEGVSEALVRRIRQEMPQTKIVALSMIFPPSYSFMSDKRRWAFDKWQRVCRVYGVPFVAMTDAITEAHQVQTPDDDTVELYYPQGNPHPTQEGHNLFFEHLKSMLMYNILPTPQKFTVDSRYWLNSQDYENGVQVVPCSKMERVGQWLENGDGSLTSDTVGDVLTLTSVFTASIMGFENSGTISYRMNGNEWSSPINLSAYRLPTRRILDNALYGQNTIQIRVESGTVTAKTLYLI